MHLKPLIYRIKQQSLVKLVIEYQFSGACFYAEHLFLSFEIFKYIWNNEEILIKIFRALFF